MAAPTALTTQVLTKQFSRGRMSVARVAFTGVETAKDVVAAVAGKQVFVLGVLYTQASAAAINLLAENADGNVAILTTQAVSSLNLPVTPLANDNRFLVHLETEVGAGLAATSAVNGNLIVWYVQE